MDKDAKKNYIDNVDNYGTIDFKAKHTPTNGWATPFVTGHKYKIHWGKTGIDFEEMRATTSWSWEPTDHPIYFVHNFTDVREKYEVVFNGQLMPNNSIAKTEEDQVTGQYVLFPSPDVRELHFIVNGKNKSHPMNETEVIFTSARCDGAC
jgi:hypothetical protein